MLASTVPDLEEKVQELVVLFTKIYGRQSDDPELDL